AGLAGAATGRRQTTRGSAADGPSLETVAGAAGAVQRAEATAGAAGVGTPVDVPVAAEVAQAADDHLAAMAGKSTTKRNTGGGPLNVDIAAIAGPGGLGSEATPDVGLASRKAQGESLQVQLRAARFQRQQVGGLPSISTAAVLPTDPFRQRTSRTPGQGGGNGSPPPQTEETIELGLAFLARYQAPDGSWSLQGFNEDAALSSDTAATGLALLAFQGAGYNHREHKYQQAVRAGLDHLLKNQKADGDLFTPMDDESNRSVWLYSHSIATIALCEAYGMTQDPALKDPAQKAVDFIIAAQNKERGGWRYAPGVGADTSVSGWMLMALKSGELAGLNVPPNTYLSVRKWLDGAQASATEKHLYRYNPLAPDTEAQRHGRAPTRTMTSVGLLMRLYLGWRRDNPDMVKGADYLLAAPPKLGTLREPERDTYYWYYATQVMFHMGGEKWQAWNNRLHPLLTSTQLKQGPLAGSWDPRTPVPDRWAIHAGRLYVTTLNLLSLEVYYRHLPIYDSTGR
ncbi:MAG TPA: terpene cyclase/mutase family protein, partial [Pirellulaceae bacterium]|nr:terpene cyclase/mutase family protein [Pirellulaceae bacterium]